MPMLDADDLPLWCALNRLIVNYWAEVDNNAGREAHEFYFPNALYAVGNNRFEGVEKIRAFYTRRRQFSEPTTRHLVTNLRLLKDDEPPVVVGLMSLYRADGRPPIQGVRPPAMIADFEARCASAEDGSWRFQSHLLRPIFVSSDLPASISIDPRRL